MSVIYNEIDPFAAAWLRELVRGGHIAEGAVNEQSIVGLDPLDVATATQFHTFAGIGVWSHALRLAGWPDDRPVWTGSCPCQPFSAAGKRGGFEDERHLWPAWFRLIRECRPPVIFGEQVASKDGLAWLDAVYADLEGAGYAVGAVDLCAAGIGAPHIRQRLFFVAERVGHTLGARLEGHAGNGDGSGGWAEASRPVAEAGAVSRPGPTNGHWRDADWLFCRDGKWRPVEPGSFPLAHGAPARVGRLRGYGNAIVAQAAAEVIRAYMERG